MKLDEQKIEELLQKTPSPRPPADLLSRLEGDIKLPKRNAATVNGVRPSFSLKRWIPALSFAGVFLTCVVVLGLQQSVMGSLEATHEELAAAQQELEQIQLANQDFESLQALVQDVSRLRKENEELQALVAEVAELNRVVAEIAAVKQENQRLQANLSAQARELLDADNDFFGSAREEARNVQCVNNLKQLGIAGHMYAGQHDGQFPQDLLDFEEVLDATIVLHCPSDKSKTGADGKDWSAITLRNISYELVSTGALAGRPKAVFLKCPVHDRVCMADGSVLSNLDERGARFEEAEDGLVEIVFPNE